MESSSCSVSRLFAVAKNKIYAAWNPSKRCLKQCCRWVHWSESFPKSTSLSSGGSSVDCGSCEPLRNEKAEIFPKTSLGMLFCRRLMKRFFMFSVEWCTSLSCGFTQNAGVRHEKELKPWSLSMEELKGLSLSCLHEGSAILPSLPSLRTRAIAISCQFPPASREC